MEHILWQDGALVCLDQRLLPVESRMLRLGTVPEVCDAIVTLAVRGAPLIGVAAAYGMAISARAHAACGAGEGAFRAGLARDAAALRATRPTAVNLFWAVSRCERAIEAALAAGGAQEAAQAALALAQRMHAEDVDINRRIGAHGAALLRDGDAVLTHCNAGALATAGYGTALGIVRAAVAQGKRIAVFADETRPLLQGARLTAYELHADGIPVTLLCDNMAGALLREGGIRRAIVGADRIAANGDTANKIGTYALAVLCRAHGVPLTVAAPLSTLDAALPDGAHIPIEHRAGEEVGHFFGVRTAPEGIAFWNPAFDVTPADLIDSIVTERGVLRAPFAPAIAEALRG